MDFKLNTVAPQEIEKFSKNASHWWDETGPHAPLHRMNPARLSYIRDQICAHFNRDKSSRTPFEELKILDIGCGGGLICEPMARMGANVTGADADGSAIDSAKAHAAESKLDIAYENKAAEEIEKIFDVVLALEILEHVTNPENFVQACAKRLKPGGLIIFSTLNRTPKSFALGVVAAEYILRWVPRGTHEWKNFIKPSTLARHTRRAELKMLDISGLIFNPINGDFELSSSDIAVNYFMTCIK